VSVLVVCDECSILLMLQMEEIVSRFGMVVCSRSGSDVDNFIYESDMLTKYQVTCLDVNTLTKVLFLLQVLCQSLMFLYSPLMLPPLSVFTNCKSLHVRKASSH